MVTSKVANAHSDSIWSVCWSGADKLLTGSLDGTLKLWNSKSMSKPLCSATKQRYGITSVVSDEDGSFAAACYNDGMVRFYQMEGDSLREDSKINVGTEDKSRTVSLSLDGQALASGAKNGQVNIWSTADSRKQHTFHVDGNGAGESAEWIMSTAWGVGNKLAACCKSGSVAIFDLQAQNLEHIVQAHYLPTRSVCFSTDGKLVYTASDDKNVSVFDVNAGKIVGSFQHGGMAVSVDVSPNGRHFAVGTSDGSVTLWDMGMQCTLSTYSTHIDQTQAVSFDKTNAVGNRFASVGDDNIIAIYE